MTNTVIDGSNMLHRVMHVPSLQTLRTSDGAYSGGIYGFVKALRTSLSYIHPDYCVVVWDTGRSARRQRLLPTYKANRGTSSATDSSYEEAESGFNYLEQYYLQREVIYNVLPLLSVRQVALPEHEADDLIYAICSRLSGPSVVVSEDRDFYQLVSPSVSVYRPIASQHVTVEEFEAEFKFPPERYVWYHAITGDGSDNIPGIPGVGPGTAMEAVRNASSLDELQRYCLHHKHARFRKIPDRWDVVMRNLELVDLRVESLSEENLRMLQEQMTVSLPLVDPMVVGAFAQKWELQSITERLVTWMDPFRSLR